MSAENGNGIFSKKAMKKLRRRRCTLKDSFKGRKDFSLLPFSYKVLGYPKELENAPYIFPACYGMRHLLYE